MNTWRMWTAFLNGAAVSAAAIGMHQDRFGGLEGYVAYLREPGHWADGRAHNITCLAFGAVSMILMTIIPVRSNDR